MTTLREAACSWFACSGRTGSLHSQREGKENGGNVQYTRSESSAVNHFQLPDSVFSSCELDFQNRNFCEEHCLSKQQKLCILGFGLVPVFSSFFFFFVCSFMFFYVFIYLFCSSIFPPYCGRHYFVFCFYDFDHDRSHGKVD